jgi:hypothetical protein
LSRNAKTNGFQKRTKCRTKIFEFALVLNSGLILEIVIFFFGFLLCVAEVYSTSSGKSCFTRYASAVSAVCMDVDVFGTKN